MAPVGIRIGQRGSAVREDIPVALGNLHRHRNGRRAERTHDEIYLVLADQPLIEGRCLIGARLVIQQDPLYGATEQTSLLIELLEEQLAGDLVDGSRGCE